MIIKAKIVRLSKNIQYMEIFIKVLYTISAQGPVFDTMTSTMAPLIITTDSSGNSWILRQSYWILCWSIQHKLWILIQLNKLSAHGHLMSFCYFDPGVNAAVVPALITVNMVTGISSVVTIVFIVWCCVIKNRKIKSKLKQQWLSILLSYSTCRNSYKTTCSGWGTCERQPSISTYQLTEVA